MLIPESLNSIGGSPFIYQMNVKITFLFSLFSFFMLLFFFPNLNLILLRMNGYNADLNRDSKTFCLCKIVRSISFISSHVQRSINIYTTTLVIWRMSSFLPRHLTAKLARIKPCLEFVKMKEDLVPCQIYVKWGYRENICSP